MAVAERVTEVVQPPDLEEKKKEIQNGGSPVKQGTHSLNVGPQNKIYAPRYNNTRRKKTLSVLYKILQAVSWEQAKKMEHKTDSVEEGKLLESIESDAGRQGSASQVDFNALPSQGALLRSKQRIRKHTPARPWKSLPPIPTGDLESDHTVLFSSLTSLQAEEFFDMVAKVQARRLNDQRADFAGTDPLPSGETSMVSEEQLYNTILAHQSQRLEDQRTEPPIPVGVQGLLDLLIRAQGTRMEDQRSTLPPGLAAPPLLRHPSFLHGV